MVRLATWVVAAGVVCAGAARGQGFCDRVKALTEEPAVAAAHWGVQVTALDGTVLCSVNAGQLFRPASNNKLLTVAAALALLGPERRFATMVVGDGELKDGVLKGNIRLIGGGDANFGSQDVPYVEPAPQPKPAPPEPATIADIEELADQIVAKGVRSVTGDVVGDDAYFEWEPYPAGWEVQDLNAGFGAPVSALTIHDSELEIDVAPGARSAAPATLAVLPDMPYYELQNRVMTGQAVPEKQRANHLRLERPVGAKTFDISGDIALGSAPVKMHVAIHDPAEYAAMVLKAALERRGVQVSGVALAKHWVASGPPVALKEDATGARIKAVLSGAAPAGLPSLSKPRMPLAMHESPNLAEDVLYTLKESQNLHAEVMMRNLGVALAGDPTPGTARALERAYLTGPVGIAGGDLVLYDGSGLSGHDLVTPRALTQLLVYAAKQPWFGTFKGALPVGGMDGTLRNRFAAGKSPLTGKVFAKTGTLGESRDLSGYVTAADGRTLVFSVMVDNHVPGTNAEALAMDRMVETIAGSAKP